MKNGESKGLIIFNQAYKERDRLVKIFTREYGKRMIFVKNADRSRLRSMIQPFSYGEFLLTVNDRGFSFLTDVGDLQVFKKISENLSKNAHAAVLLGLADSALPDNVADNLLYDFLIQILEKIESGLDEAVLLNIFELQLLTRFGVQLNLSECVFCHRTRVPLDFSFKFDGCLCADHFPEDPHRLHLEPNTLYLAAKFLDISLDELHKISFGKERKAELRAFIDELYDNYVGLRLKSKRFLDEMDSWAI